MNLVKPVFTEYERQVLHEIALHRLQPNSVQRILDTTAGNIGAFLRGQPFNAVTG